MTRSNRTIIAAVILLVISLVEMIMWQIPEIMRGAEVVNQLNSAGEGPPYNWILISFAKNIVALVAAYGLWNSQRWGIILAIVASAWTILANVMVALFGQNLIAAAIILLSFVVIFLCLWRENEPLPDST